MKIAVCDDELVAREAVVTCLEDYSVERKLNIEYEVFESYTLLESKIEEFDIFVIDYQTPEIDGMTFAKILREKFGDEKTIIFVTSFREIVYDAFTVKTHRFLIKPIERNKFFEALDSCITTEDKNLVLKSDGINDVVNTSDILYIEVRGKECYICTESEQIVSRKAITFFEDKLEKAGFFRVHRSYLVNMRKVRSFDKSKIELVNGEKIDISARKYAAFCKEYIKLK